MLVPGASNFARPHVALTVCGQDTLRPNVGQPSAVLRIIAVTIGRFARQLLTDNVAVSVARKVLV